MSKLRHVTLVLNEFGPPLQVDCVVVTDDDLVREAVRAFSRCAPCSVLAFEKSGDQAMCGKVELTVSGRLVP